MAIKEDDIEKKVILLKLLLKESDESIDELLYALADTKMATIERLKELFAQLQKDGYISKDAQLTMIGTIEAKKAKQEFTL